jgi:hypothetical protein
MGYDKEIVCLANSRRPPLGGRCIAGIERTITGWGGWIRPVSAGETEAISEQERNYEDGSDPQLLDTISIRFLEPNPKAHQVENHVIDSNYYWEKTGTMDWEELEDLTESVEGPLWQNGLSTYNGLRDKVPGGVAQGFDSSLLLIRPSELELSGAREGYQGPCKLKVRAKMSHNGHEYSLVVTDPKIEREFFAKGVGRYPMKADDVYLCISLSAAFHDFCYKLVASIIRRPI